MTGSTGGNLPKNQKQMKKLDFKQKKYVLPLLALPFLMLFVYIGAQFNKEDTSEKDQPKELSLSLGETQDSIMTKNDAYDAFFKKELGLYQDIIINLRKTQEERDFYKKAYLSKRYKLGNSIVSFFDYFFNKK